MNILVPSTPTELDHVRALFREFVAWHRERHTQDLHLIDSYFDTSAFEAELAGLPGHYALPTGALLLAQSGSEPVGCVALRQIDAETCEMKRMFVRPQHHGHGLGRALGDAIIACARDLRYRRMLLDTSFRQAEALSLYRRMGFRDIPPPESVQQPLREWLIFMELVL